MAVPTDECFETAVEEGSDLIVRATAHKLVNRGTRPVVLVPPLA